MDARDVTCITSSLSLKSLPSLLSLVSVAKVSAYVLRDARMISLPAR
jgi:hypothetical protein